MIKIESLKVNICDMNLQCFICKGYEIMLKTFFIELRKKWIVVTILAVIQMVTMIFSVILPLMNGKFLDLLITDISGRFLIKYALVIIIVGSTSSIFTYIYGILSIQLKNKISFELNLNVLNHLHKIPMRNFEKYNAAYLNQRVNNDSTIIAGFFFDNVLVIIMNLLQIIMLIFILKSINIPIVTLVLLFIPIYILAYIILKNPLYKNGLQYKESQSNFFDKLNEQFELNKEIKIHSSSEKMEKLLRKQYENFLYALMNMAKISNLFNSVDSIICLFFQAIILILGGCQVVSKKISIGEFSILNVYFTVLLGIIKYFFDFAKKYQDYKVSIKRMDDLLNIKIDEDGYKTFNKIEEISFEHNNMKYKFVKGKINAVCGKNGSGKTTLFYKILGIIPDVKLSLFYDLEPYNIINKYKLRENNISYMLQNEKVENISVKDFLYQNLNIDSITKMKNVICEKGLDNLVLSQYYDLFSLLDKQINNISDGEKQIIILVRTLAKEANIYMLDEPTSNLNGVITEILINYLNQIKKDKIVIIISHDKVILHNSDVILEV